MGVKSTLFAVIVLFCSALTMAQSPRKISGYVRDRESNKLLANVNVYTTASRQADRRQYATTTDAGGHYVINLPDPQAEASLTQPHPVASPDLTLLFSLVGYEPQARAVSATTTLDVWLMAGQTLQEVVIKSSVAAPKISELANMSQMNVPVDQLAKIPALLGERDVLKVIQLMPGVQKSSEGSTNMYVRGGGPDQNLFLLDDAIVYNPSHLFGFFSVFNGDVLRNVSLTKGGFPANYGGRLSSVIETTMKEGSKDRIHGQGSVGVIASRFTLDGPIANGKATFLISGRRSYYGLLSSLIQPKKPGNMVSKTYFYDINMKFTWQLTDRDKLSLSGYTGYDDFTSSRSQNTTSYKSVLNWGNRVGNLRWQHQYTDRLTSTASLAWSSYQLEVGNQESIAFDSLSRVFQLKYLSSIRDLTLKYDWNWSAGKTHQLRFGVASTWHQFKPGAVVQDASGDAEMGGVQVTNAVESGLYAEDTWSPNARWRIQAGLRISHYAHPEVQFLRPEPRASVAYVLPRQWSLKASYARMNQYVHILSNTGPGLPTDLWVPTTRQVSPQQSEQVAAGVAKDISTRSGQRGFTLTVEGYYKRMNQIISLRQGATFMNPLSGNAGWEQNITAGRGWAYGTEVMLQKQAGRLSGWLGYTLSWTKWQFDELNNGKVFFPRYDRRHNLSVVGMYDLGKHLRVSAIWVYGTGQALTLPLSRYIVNTNKVVPGPTTGTEPSTSRLNKNVTVRDYGDLNSFRTEPYHRLDLSLQYQRQGRRFASTWEIGVYNAYNRANPFYYAMESEKDPVTKVARTVLRRYSLFPAVPSLSYSVKF